MASIKWNEGPLLSTLLEVSDSAATAGGVRGVIGVKLPHTLLKLWYKL